jgi:hypothetical protein
VTLKKDFLILIAFLTLSAGVYYAGAKFHVPWYGGNDFKQYYQMTLNPLNNNSQSPWAFRLIVPMLAHLILKSGMFYESGITPYKDHYLNHMGIDYEPSILSAIIFTNYIFLALAAFFIYKSTKLIFDQAEYTDKVMPVMMPSLLFLSFSTTVHGYAGLTEGGSLFFISFLCFLALKNNLILFIFTCFLSIFNRELIPLIMLIYVFFSSAQKRRPYFVITSILAFTIYFTLKSYLQIPGNEHQTDMNSLISNVLTFSVNKEFFMQAILANNIPIFVGVLIIFYGVRNLKPFIPYAIIIIILFILGIATGIGYNVGRILNLATPILIIGLAEMTCCLRTRS